jgi:glycerol-3-phosphate dehydrogenase
VISNNRNKDPSKEKRDHQVWVDQGLVSVSGGKLTTFRLIARDTLAAAKPLLRDARFDNRDQCIFPPTSLTPAALGLQDTPWALRLIGRYGEAAKSLLADTPAAEQQKIEGTEFCLAELRWSCRNEQIVHLDDLLLRRSRIGLLISAGGSGIFSGVRIICQQELGWNDSRWLDELQRYQTLWRQHYSLPGT